MLLKSLLSEGITNQKKTLFKNEWISMMSVPANDGSPYIYSHETRCNGNIVAILLYERVGKDGWNYGLRSERTPCWSGEFELSSVTGGVEDGMTPEQAAIVELKEEAGLDVPQGSLKSLGTCRGTKSCDTIYHLYALDVAGMTKGTPTGEDVGEIVWLHGGDAMKKVVDPIWYVMFSRLGFN